MDLDTLIFNTISTILEKDKLFCKFSRPYLFTTENIKGYYELLDFENKDILTVCSSGDHILNAILCGANKVDSFDINYFQKLVFDLKRATIRCFTNIDDFKNFFSKDDKFLNIDDYNMIKNYFDLNNISEQESKKYWDQFISLRNLYYIENFFKEYNLEHFYTSKNMYFNQENYLKLKKKINNVETNFVNCNILDLSKSIHMKYDLILLSNIADYLKDIYKENHLINYHDLIVNEISQLLNEDGKIICAYLYYYKFFQANKYISDPQAIRKIFIDFSTIPVNHKLEVNDDSEDAILVYKK